MKTPHLSLTLLASCLSLSTSAQVVLEDFSNPSQNGSNSATGYLGTAGNGYDYNDNFGTWLYSSGNMGIDDAARGDGSGSDTDNAISSIGQARLQDFRGTNARATSVVFDDSLFTDGVEYTVSFDVIGDSSGADTGRYWLAEVYGYDSGGTVQIDGVHGGWASGATKPFTAANGASVNYLADYVAINGENFAGTFEVEFTFVYDASNSPDIAFAVGTYNNIFAIDNFTITEPAPLPTVTTVIQFGGDEAIITDSSHISQIGGGTQVDQIIDWVGNSSEGGTASGSVGGSSTMAAGSTLNSDSYGLSLTSVSVTGTGATGTRSSGNPNVLGVDPADAAKFDASTSEGWTFEFNEDVKLRQLVFAALNFDGETVNVSGGATASFTRTDSNMAAVTYGDTTNRYVYTFPTPLDIAAGTDIIIQSTQGTWGLQAVVVEFEYSAPPPTIPDAFEPNPDGGIEPAPLTRLDPAPNVILFVADDMGIGDTSAYQDLTGAADNVQIDTPEMERLADMGTRFTDVHTNGATCSPTRIALLSGTYSLRSPLKMAAVQDSEHVKGVILPGRRTTIAHMMQRAGFATYGYGKWHMALRGDSGEDTDGDGVIDTPGTGLLAEGPIESGFDTWTGTPGNFSYAGAMIQDNQYMRFGSSDPTDYSLVPINDPSAQPWVGQGPASPTDANLYKVQPVVFEKLQTDLNTHMDSRGNEPFFIYYASHANHDPWVPANYDPNHPDGPRASLNGVVIDTAVTKAGGMIEIQTVPDFSGDGIPDPDYSVYGGDGTDWIWNDALRLKMWDHVSAVDTQGKLTINGPTNRAMMVQENDVIVGYMLDFLEQTDDPRNPGYKLIDNTIFIFTSDNGADARSEIAAGSLPQSSDNVITDLRAFKGSRWEGGSRVPFIASWPTPGDPNQASGVPAGKTSPAVFGLNDVYATLAEAIGYRLHEQEAVDSESLLPDWTDPVQIETAVTVRDTDMLSKYQQFVFSRRGELKLAAEDISYPGTLTAQQARQDRFANNSTLDFLDMGFTDLFDLTNDLSEQTDLGNTATATDMLSSMSQMLTQGYSRAGAAAFENGLNFIGGDLFTDANWHAYKASRNGIAAGSTTPGIIAEDGTASGDILNRTYVHRAATIDYSPASGGFIGSLYELDGGTLNVDESLRMTNSRLEVFRGSVEIGAHDLELNGTNCVVILSGGEINATKLSVGEAGNSAGFKIVRFKGGAGSLNLAGSIAFGDDGDSTNDYIDFVSGSRGRFVSPVGSVNYNALWDLGHLRIDGVAGATGGFAASNFEVIILGDGNEALVLADGVQIVAFDFDADRISDVWEQDKVGSTNVLTLTGDSDADGILDVDEYVLDFDPTSPEAPFAASVVWNSANSVDIHFGSKSSRNYLVQYCSDLASGVWTALTVEAGNDGVFSLNDDPLGAERGFYKVEVFIP